MYREERSKPRRVDVCFIGSVLYDVPLHSTAKKKFRALADLGGLDVIGFSKNLRPRAYTEYARFYLLPHLPTAALRYLLVYTLGLVLAMILILHHRARILVAQSPYEGVVAVWAKRLARLVGRRTAVVVESHGDFVVAPFLHQRRTLSVFYRHLVKALSAYSLRNADVLRAISSSTRAQLEEWAPGKPIIQFPTWTDIDVFLRAGGETSEVCDTKTFVFAGALTPTKGVDTLLDAFAMIAARNAHVNLSIIGHAQNEEYAHRLEQQVLSLDLSERVRFISHVEQADLARHMAEAEALILPSVAEGLGRVVFEAMATGTPVVASDVGGIGDMVTEGETGHLFPARNAAALAERLEQILRDPQHAKIMGQKARDFAMSFYSTESYVLGYSQLFQQASKAVHLS
jgi:glycosyltransferase involved in cell wall biosynthesis